ncbi:uncharacterized protein LOC143298144 [Babylonia areolata]|uniref:uncharacterized protein LOC143298144 n=1 Tax=Babylonia areolata TaxID=304850 RepID=UPI003FD64E28
MDDKQKIMVTAALLVLLLWAAQNGSASVVSQFYVKRTGVGLLLLRCCARRTGVVSVFGIDLYVTNNHGGWLNASISSGSAEVRVSSMLHLAALGEVSPGNIHSFLELVLPDPDPDTTLTAHCRFFSSQAPTKTSAAATTPLDMNLLTCCVADHCSDQDEVSSSQVCGIGVRDITRLEIRRTQNGPTGVMLTPMNGSSPHWQLAPSIPPCTHTYPILYKIHITNMGASQDMYVHRWPDNTSPDYTCTVHSHKQHVCQLALHGSQADAAPQKEGLVGAGGVAGIVVSIVCVLGVCGLLWFAVHKRRGCGRAVKDSEPHTTKPLKPDTTTLASCPSTA